MCLKLAADHQNGRHAFSEAELRWLFAEVQTGSNRRDGRYLKTLKMNVASPNDGLPEDPISAGSRAAGYGSIAVKSGWQLLWALSDLYGLIASDAVRRHYYTVLERSVEKRHRRVLRRPNSRLWSAEFGREAWAGEANALTCRWSLEGHRLVENNSTPSVELSHVIRKRLH